MTKTIMTVQDLKKAGSEVVTILDRGEINPTSHDLATPGFYFLVNTKTGLVHARFYFGRQRSQTGFRDTLTSIRSGRTGVTRKLQKGTYLVEFIAAEKMKPLTTGFGKGQIAMAFTASHNDRYQNLEEMNRTLADNFSFVLQKY